MNEEAEEQVYELKERISDAVCNLVDEMTWNVSCEVDNEVRQQLTEQFRFWRK